MLGKNVQCRSCNPPSLGNPFSGFEHCGSSTMRTAHCLLLPRLGMCGASHPRSLFSFLVQHLAATLVV